MRAFLKKNLVLIILVILSIFFVSLFLFEGIASNKELEFFLPRRFVKIAAILIVSFTVGYSAKTFQTITNNKLLTPSVMGFDNIYMFIQTIIIFISGSVVMMSGISNFLISLLLMIGVTLILYFLLFKTINKSIYILILSGTIISTLFASITSFMQVIMDPNEYASLEAKLFPSFSNVNKELLVISFIIVLVVIIVTIKDYKKYDCLLLGTDNAINLGINYKRFILKSLIITAVLTAVSVSLVGPITFLGLIVISISRMLFKRYKHMYQIITIFFLSILFLTSALFLTERVFNMSVNMNVIINFVGGFLFIVLLIKEVSNARK
ncbi:MAG: iron chelate uptake ABC transporter family permease subunit [Anaeroplasmataceae bacterium]